jgi:hypothetical protein
MNGIVYCEECGQASGFTGEPPTHQVLAHSDECMHNVEDYALWDGEES